VPRRSIAADNLLGCAKSEDLVAHRRERSLYLASLVAIAALVGCSGSQPNQVEGSFIQPEVPTAKADAPAATETAPATEEGLTEDQKAQMEIALRRGGEKAANCAKVVPDGPRGEGEVKVTFDGKKGRATDVAVGPPWAGTDVESCIKRSFVGEIVVPFDGELEVPYTVKLPAKPEDASKTKPGAKPAKDPKKK
jgi:hypothetical protein